MISSDMKQVVTLLENDWDFIQSFLNNPLKALKKFKLSNEERNTLSTRNLSGLMSLGLNEAEAVRTSSGAHSQTCPQA